MSQNEIFIGRKRELEAFEQSLELIQGPKRSFLQKLFGSASKRKDSDAPFPRVFLFYGEGGFGKTELVHQCVEKAEAWNFRVIHLDWDDYYFRKSSLPNTSRKMITALFTVLTDSQFGIARHFDEYLEVESRLEKIAEKVERVWQEDMSAVTGAIAKVIPAPELVQSVVSGGLNALQKEVRQALLNHIRDNRRMKREEIDLYENNEKALTDALVKGLEAAARDKPVFLAIDTYEQVDEPDIEDWMRRYFLRNLLEKTTRVLVAVSGRNDHYQEYRNSLNERYIFNRHFDDILFTNDEVSAFAGALGVPLEPGESALIREHTAGIPLVVKDILTLIRDGKNKEEVLADLPAHAGAVEDIVSSIVERFLKYTEEKGEWREDRYRCYQIAMLRDFSPEILQKAWELSPREFSDQMAGWPAGILSSTCGPSGCTRKSGNFSARTSSGSMRGKPRIYP